MVEQHQLNGKKDISDNPEDTFLIPEAYRRKRQSDPWVRPPDPAAGRRRRRSRDSSGLLSWPDLVT